jgi:hypothetical protein
MQSQLNPRKRWQANSKEAAKKLENLTIEEWFQDACQTAMLQMQVDMPASLEVQVSFANLNRLKGAQQFCNVLLNLWRYEENQQKPNTGLKY